MKKIHQKCSKSTFPFCLKLKKKKEKRKKVFTFENLTKS